MGLCAERKRKRKHHANYISPHIRLPILSRGLTHGSKCVQKANPWAAVRVSSHFAQQLSCQWAVQNED